MLGSFIVNEMDLWTDILLNLKQFCTDLLDVTPDKLSKQTNKERENRLLSISRQT